MDDSIKIVERPRWLCEMGDSSLDVKTPVEKTPTVVPESTVVPEPKVLTLGEPSEALPEAPPAIDIEKQLNILEDVIDELESAMLQSLIQE